jgi:hypothetical protein
MRILKFLHKTAKSVDQRIDGGPTEQPAQRQLGRSGGRLSIRPEVFDAGFSSRP